MQPFKLIIGQSEHPIASTGALHKFVRELSAREVPITFVVVCQVCHGGTREPPRLAGRHVPCPGCRGAGGGRHAFASTDALKDFVLKTVPMF
jgi:hypothetical protein